VSARILITGAAGFIAGHLVTALRAAGAAHITGADARPIATDLCNMTVAEDLLAPGAMQRVVAACAPDEVYHLVGAIRGTDDVIERSNVESTRLLLDSVRTHSPLASVVLVGSAAEYGLVPRAAQPVPETHRGAPAFAYGRAKREVSALGLAAARDGLKVAVARPFNVIGAGAPDILVAGALVRRLRDAQGGPAPRRIAVGITTGVRDFIDALDVGHGLVTIARRGVPGAAYNLCTGRGHSVAEVVSVLIALAGGDVIVDEDPSLSRAGEVDVMIGSPAKAASLGWRAVRPFEESLRGAWEASAPVGAAR
jgi:GDP-4-dehydro-6-deoxy-D-mannose reductase